jgi:DNA-binding HxlR family transcriptional regulator
MSNTLRSAPDDIMDEYCIKIFGFLGFTTKKYRFNELHRTLNNLGVKISKPTLIEHLQHLQNKKYIVRKQEDKQTVSYETNWEKLEFLKEGMAYRRKVEQDLKNEKTFKSLTLEDQVITIASILALSELFRVKADILDLLEPTKKAEHGLSYIVTGRLLDMYRLWLLDVCKESKENSEKALQLVQKGIDGFQQECFGRY